MNALFTDLYELTMAASYLSCGLDSPATFDLFVRSLPPARRFLVACGLEQALDFLEGLRFTHEDVRYLASLDRFGGTLLDRLATLRFTGEVWAVPEGEAVFGGEPILRVTAPLVEASLVETALINLVGHQTMVASKAARVALASGGRAFVDFAARREHGPDAALFGARAAWVAGAAGTSLVEAGRRWGLPLSGTMAHAYVMRFPTEEDAFRAYACSGFGEVVLLLDTFDTEAAARTVVRLVADGCRVDAVRLDSGDLLGLAFAVREILDEGRCQVVRIFASGDLDEWRIAELLDAGAPIDGFGVGTRMGTSADAPWLGMVYKLAEDADGPKAKASVDKATLPGRKQVWRRRDSGGRLVGDVIGLQGEAPRGGGEPMLEPVMVGGDRTVPPPPLEVARARCHATLESLPDELRVLDADGGESYPVALSQGLRDLSAQVARR